MSNCSSGDILERPELWCLNSTHDILSLFDRQHVLMSKSQENGESRRKKGRERELIMLD
jgi:hypothetical protein